MITKRKMLTTTDNPYNPFTQFDQWYDYDLLAHHNSCGMSMSDANILHLLLRLGGVGKVHFFRLDIPMRNVV